MGNHHVTTTANECVVTFICFHKSVPPLPTHYDLPEKAYWGRGAGSHKFSKNVKHQGLRIALEGHDLGSWLWLVPLSLVNTILPIEMASSYRKMNFSASTVRINGTPTGVSNFPGTPMLACSIGIPMPAYPFDNEANTVLVGMTTADYANGWIGVAGAVATELISVAMALGGGEVTKVAFILGELGVPFPLEKELLIKPLVAAQTGIVQYLATGRGSFEVSVGTPPWSGKFSVSGEREKGAWITPAEVDVEGGGAVWPFSGNTDPTFDNHETTTTNLWDGSSSTREKTTTENPDGTSTETVTEEEFDPEGKKKSGNTTTTEYDADGNPKGPPTPGNHRLPRDPRGSSGDEPL